MGCAALARLARILACAALGALDGPLAAAEPARAPADDGLLLLQVRLGRVVLNDSFAAYAARAGTLLPLGELCQDLDLAIQVDTAKGLAEGFLIDEKRRFRLDARTGELTVGGRTRLLDRTLMELRPDDLYLEAGLLSQCLPVDLRVDPRAAALTVTPREPLPLQQRWQREGQAAGLDPGATAPSYPSLPDPYRLLEFPAVDATLGLTGASPAAGGRRFATQGSLLAAGDLLHLSTDLFANLRDPGGLTDYHLTMGRRDPQGGLLGPLRATEFELGEVQSAGLNLVAYPWSGTGTLVGNQGQRSGEAFDRHSFRGDLPQGWQVELYRNQSLVAFQGSRQDGRYEFLNIPLYFGLNDFRLVFYGPQGQRRQQAVPLDVSQNQTPPGTFRYQWVELQAGAVAPSRSLFQLSYGLTPQLAALAGTARTSSGGAGRRYGEAGLQGFWRPVSGSLNTAWNGLGGAVAELALRTRLGPLSLVGKRTELRHGFTSELFQPTLGSIRSRTGLDASVPLPGPGRSWLTLDFSGYRDQLEAGGTSDNLNGRLGLSAGGFFVSNVLTRTRGHGLAAPVPASTSGAFLVSKVFKGIALRGEADYSLDDARRLDSLTFTGDGFQAGPFAFRSELDYAVANRDAALHLGASKNRGAWSLGADLGYSTRSLWSASLTLRLGLEREPRGGKFFTTAQGAASTGAVSVEAFLDANANGRHDPGERPLPNLAFNVNGNRQARLTDAQGVAFLEGLPQGQDSNLSLATGTLEDPLMRPAIPGLRITPRPGHVTRVSMPIVIYSEINGTVYLRRDGQALPAAGVRLELRDGAGRVVKSMRTAYDGFYSLDELPPGRYRLEVPEAAARQRGVKPPAPRGVLLSPEGTLLDGQDLVLEPVQEVPATGEDE
jgi:hypothetical protein